MPPWTPGFTPYVNSGSNEATEKLFWDIFQKLLQNQIRAVFIFARLEQNTVEQKKEFSKRHDCSISDIDQIKKSEFCRITHATLYR
jgi:hypothetical protein